MEGGGFQADLVDPGLTVTRSISSFRPEYSPSSTKIHTHTALQRPILPFVSSRLILASPIDLRQHLHSSRCGVAVETVAFPRLSDYCHLPHGTPPTAARVSASGTGG